MREEHLLTFGAFRLDVVNECLWHEAERLRLPPKDFAVLRSLVERAGQLVTKDELFQTVWAETVVSDAALTKCVRAVRQVLGDTAKTPQFIETVHRRGYRFIAPLTTVPPPVQGSRFKVLNPHSAFRNPQSLWWAGKKSYDNYTTG